MNLIHGKMDPYNELSEKAKNILKINGLVEDSMIIDYYVSNGSFIYLRSCGYKTNTELTRYAKLLLEYEGDKKVDKIYGDLIRLDRLTVRSVNVLRFNNIKTIEDLRKIYESDLSFLSLRNIGIKSNEELINYMESLPKIKNDNKPIEISSNVVLEKTIIELHLLSNRAKNTLRMNSLTNIYDLKKIYDRDFSFRSLRNIGDKTNRELIKYYKRKINDVLNETSETEVQIQKYQQKKDNYLDTCIDLIISKYSKLIAKFFQNITTEDFINFILSGVSINQVSNYYKEDFISLRKEIELLFEKLEDESSENILNKLVYNYFHRPNKSEDIFEAIYKYFEKELDGLSLIIFKQFFCTNTTYVTLEEIGNKFRITRERVRQIRLKLIEKITTNYYRLDLLFQYFNINKSDKEDLLILSSNENKHKLNIYTIGLFYKLYFNRITYDSFNKFFIQRKFILKKSNNQIKNVYLLNEKFHGKIDFNQFLIDLNHIKRRKINIFDIPKKKFFDKYLLNTFDEDSQDILYDILLNEFEILESNQNITIKNGSLNTADEILLTMKLLGANKNGYKLEDILLHHSYKFKTNKYINNISAFRSIISNHKQILPISRTSTYLLKEWEYESTDIKSGTFRDITVEFLSVKDEMQHIYNISKYVNKFRKTNPFKLSATLNANNKEFIINGNYFGLRDLNHKMPKIKYNSINGGVFNLKNHKQFIGQNLENLITFYVDNYNYDILDVRMIFDKKISDNKLLIDSNNTILAF